MTEPERNAGQIEYWNGEVGRRWARLQDQLDDIFGDVTAAAIEAAAPHEGSLTSRRKLSPTSGSR